MRELNIHLTHLQNDEHFLFHGEFGDIVECFGAAELKIEPQFALWEELFDREDEALKKVTRSARTEEIRAADRVRDEVYRGMVEICHGNTRHFNDEFRRAARELQVVIDTYGNLTRKNLKTKTSAIMNLVHDLNENHSEELEFTGLNKWVDELERCNTDCYQLMKERWDQAASQTRIVMKEARAALDAAYNDIIARIRARVLLELEGSEIYDGFFARLGVVIDSYNRTLAQRRGRGEHSSNAGINTSGINQ